MKRLIILLAFICAACVPTTAATPTLNSAAPSTPRATFTVPPPTVPIIPTESPTPPLPTLTPIPTPLPPCKNDAKFVNDLTVPDGKQFLPGQRFIKQWSVQNTGSCDWGPDYRLVFISGDPLDAPKEVALYPAKVGTLALWEIAMTAPQTPGLYESRWEARDPEGKLFGPFVFAKIEVIAVPTP